MTRMGEPLTIALEAKVCAALARRDGAMRRDLTDLVAIPTGGNYKPGLDACRGTLIDRLKALGAALELVPGDPKPEWLHGVVPGDAPPTAVCRGAHHKEGRARALICCHIDTVFDPAGAFREVSVAPNGTTATGPGVVDMKGGIVIVLHALEALEEAGAQAAWTVLLNSDEETGSYYSETALRNEALRHDVGICTEPALPDGGLVVERLGSGQFMIEAHGRAAHVGRDFEQGRSAVYALAKAVARIAEMPDPARGRIVNVGPLVGGVATNVVPELARAWGNVRFPSATIAEELGAMIDALATPEGELPRVVVRRSFNRPAKPLTPSVQRLAELVREAAEGLGQKLPFGKTGGVCDGNILQDAGLPTVDTLGVRGGGLHTEQEWIELASLVERAQLMAVTLLRLGRLGHRP